MKNKSTTYLLLVVAVIVWGYIIFQLIDFTNDNVYVSNTVDNLPILSDDTTDSNSQYTLLMSYRDPFLERRKVVTTAVVKKKINPKPKPIEKPKIIIRWPRVTYKGLIKNQASDKLVGMLQVDRNDHLISLGDSIDDIVIREIFNDSIQVSISTETKTFIK